MSLVRRISLPRDMRFVEYDAWLQQEYQQLKLDPVCVQIGPFNIPTLKGRPPWNMDWCVRFPDGKHFNIKERWWPRPIRYGGRGYRQHFAFHYGETSPLSDARGFPIKDNSNFRTIIRIDSDAYNPHLHFHGQDHIGQEKVRGFNLSDAEPFTFVQAVLQHRETGDDFDKIMQFTVTI
jgi:hypothetical protein